MTSVLTGFADAGAWARRADGTIVGRARNGSWAERVRNNVPIEDMMPTTGPEPESCIITPVATYEEHVEPWWRGAGGHTEATMDDVGEDYYAYWEYGLVFPKEPDVRTTRQKRRAPKAAAKPPKYGPKVTKLRTVAEKVLAEPPVLSESVAVVEVNVAPRRNTPPRDSTLDLYHAVMAWIHEMHDAFGGDVMITEEDLELERQLERQRAARYER